MTDTNFQSSQDPHIMQTTIIQAVENEYLPTATLKPIFFREKNIPILYELSKVCIEIGKLEEEERQLVENNESDESHEINEENDGMLLFISNSSIKNERNLGILRTRKEFDSG